MTTRDAARLSLVAREVIYLPDRFLRRFRGSRLRTRRSSTREDRTADFNDNCRSFKPEFCQRPAGSKIGISLPLRSTPS